MDRSAGARFLLAFGVVLALKGDTLLQLPVWDTAMALFPAALTLVRNGFDFFELAGMLDFKDGGPRVHAGSPVTVATAVVWWATGGGEFGLAVLHLLHFGVAALALALLFQLARPILGAPASVLLCLCTLLQPVFSAQVGFVYLEVPLFLCAVAALLTWSEGRFAAAIVWSTLAAAVKQTGLIVPAALALATLLERRPLRERAARIAWLVLPPVALVALLETMVALSSQGGPGQLRFFPRFGYPAEQILQYIVHYARRFLFNVPDLVLLLAIFLVLAAWRAPRIFAALRREPTDRSARDPGQHERVVLGLSGLLIGMFLVLSYAAVPAITRYAIVLPRYFVVVLPFLLLWLGWGLRDLFGGRTRASAVGFGVLAVLFAVNTNGVLYPPDVDTEGPGNDPPLTERSNAYRRLQALQLEAVRFVADLPGDPWVYYGQYEHYLFQYPEMGWVRAPLANGHSLSLEPVPDLTRADRHPPCAYVLTNYPWGGGARLRALLAGAATSEALSTEVVRRFRDGPYEIVLHRIRRGDAECPS